MSEAPKIQWQFGVCDLFKLPMLMVACIEAATAFNHLKPYVPQTQLILAIFGPIALLAIVTFGSGDYLPLWFKFIYGGGILVLYGLIMMHLH